MKITKQVPAPSYTITELTHEEFQTLIQTLYNAWSENEPKGSLGAAIMQKDIWHALTTGQHNS
jgi:hypothetical protein